LTASVNDARLHNRSGPDRLDRIGQALQPVTDQHQHIVQSAVLQVSEHLQPVLRALAAVARPNTQDVPGALDGDGHDHVDGPVGDLPVPDLHVDGIHEQNGIDTVERPVGPFGHPVHHLVGDGGDGLLGDLGSVDLGQMRGDLPVGEALRGQRQHHLVHAGQPALPLAHDLRLEGALHIAGHLDLDRPDVSQHGLRPGAIAAVPGVLPRRIVLVIAEVAGDLALQGGFQNPLGQLLQQPARTRQLHALTPSPVDQHLDQLLVRRGHTDRFRHGLGLARHLTHLASP
jgi:hypothetical protein